MLTLTKKDIRTILISLNRALNDLETEAYEISKDPVLFLQETKKEKESYLKLIEKIKRSNKK